MANTKMFYFYVSFFLIAIKTNCQTIKNYNGKFEDGIATYQYFESTQMDRIIHGAFSYIGSLFDMKGSYKNGKKTGRWEITAYNKQYMNRIKLNTKIYGSYNSGQLVGNWIYSNSIRFLNSGTINEDREIANATFYNNHFIGKISYQASWPLKYSMEGEFDSLGFMSGTWIYTEDELKDEIRFINGVAYWRLFNNTNNGAKKIFCDSLGFVKEFWGKYDSKIGISKINEKYYYADTVLISSNTRVSGEFENNAIKIGDSYSDSGIRNGTFNPVCIWMDEDISIYESGGLTNPLYYYKEGSIRPNGFQIVIKECDYYTDCFPKLQIALDMQKKQEEEKLRIEEEKLRIEKEKLRIEKERLETLLQKVRFDSILKQGDAFFKLNRYKEAIKEYYSASTIIFSNEVITKINVTKNEINRIDSLQKLRLDTYNYLKTRNATLISEIAILKVFLEDYKKNYGKNYELCVNFLSVEFSSYFSIVNTMFITNNTNGLKIEDTWNQTDQDALEILTKFNKEFHVMEKFHFLVKKAYDTGNKEQLKLLKSSDTKEIISKFLTM